MGELALLFPQAPGKGVPKKAEGGRRPWGRRVFFLWGGWGVVDKKGPPLNFGFGAFDTTLFGWFWPNQKKDQHFGGLPILTPEWFRPPSLAICRTARR